MNIKVFIFMYLTPEKTPKISFLHWVPIKKSHFRKNEKNQCQYDKTRDTVALETALKSNAQFYCNLI